MRVLLCILGLMAAGCGSLVAESYLQVARTQENALNDLVRELPLATGSWREQLRRRSALQEQLYLHELRMRGEGLPQPLAARFSSNYSTILAALVEDRLSEDEGRQFLSRHRRLLAAVREGLRVARDPDHLREEFALKLEALYGEIVQRTLSMEEVPETLRTPVVNGFEAWLGELLAWAESGKHLAGGRLARLHTKLADLERFEQIYKADGVLQKFEREKLHERLLDLALEVVEVVSR